jgi:hypothetical protein
MSETSLIVRLNALKHHCHYLESRIVDWKNMDWGMVREELLELGNNQFDMYTGELEVQDICQEVEEYLLKNRVLTREDVHTWLGKAGYKTIQLSDRSLWIIREGELSSEPVHIHPARHQTMVKRMKSTHVKTAVAIIIETGGQDNSYINFNTMNINIIRSEKIGLSTVKSVKESNKILETLFFFTRHPSNSENKEG